MDTLMNTLSTLSMNAMVFMFVVGSLGMGLGFDFVRRGKRSFLLVTALFSLPTIPLIIDTMSADFVSILFGLVVSLIVGAFLVKIVQLVAIIVGAIRYEDIYPETDTKS